LQICFEIFFKKSHQKVCRIKKSYYFCTRFRDEAMIKIRD
jgi:hypothetical protein